MLPADVVELILGDRARVPHLTSGEAFAPTNIALVKYWGKRDPGLNLPITDSLSISLGAKGAATRIEVAESPQDNFFLNDHEQEADSTFSSRLSQFLDLFRFDNIHYRVYTKVNIPIAAGLASSACGFAAIVKALSNLYGWELSSTELSILARLGSGSACRSIYPGFVWWQKGTQADGMDCYALPLAQQWPELRIGLLLINQETKAIGSRPAMQNSLKTSYLYGSWPQQAAHDLNVVHEAILSQNFDTLGTTSEHNALSMHATMISAWPPIVYSIPETLAAMHKIWYLRQQGLPLYFTQDAGPNLKLLFLQNDLGSVLKEFPGLEVIAPFAN